MNSKGIGLMLVGAVAGFAAGFFVGKKRTEKIKEEEIQSILDEWHSEKDKNKESKQISENTENVEEHQGEEEGSDDDEEEAELPPHLRDIYRPPTSYIREVGTNPSKTANIELIEEDDFGQYEDDMGLAYETEFMYYYADGVLATDDNEVITDIEGTIGQDALKHFKKMDEFWVRNHDLELDIDVLKSQLTFEELKQREATYDVE